MKDASGFTREERAAMKARADELKAEARAGKKKQDNEAEVLARISEMPEPDRAMATHLHEVITKHAPTLAAKTWYGMPAYARDGKVVCFFQSAQKFGTRYATLGFSDKASLDDGDLWPTAFALANWTPAVEKKVVALVRKATD